MSWRSRFGRLFRDRALARGFAAFESDRFAALREGMVREQIERRGIRDPRVLAAMRKVERHRFLPPNRIDEAYSDKAVAIGSGQTISQPYIVAVMSEVLRLNGEERVLEVGTGSGYQAAILGELAREVFTIERIPAHFERARTILAELSCGNVTCVLGDGAKGLPEGAPFDAILVAAAGKDLPQPLIDQLADGGRLVIPVGVEQQELLLYEKHDGTAVGRSLFPVQFVPLVTDRPPP